MAKLIELDNGYKLILNEGINESLPSLIEKANEQIRLYSPFDILTPAYLDKDNNLFYHGGGFTLYEKIPYPDAQGEEDINQFPEIRTVDFSPLWAFIISENAFRSLEPIPKFDINIYTHADFVLNAQKLGFEIKVSPTWKLKYFKTYLFVQKREKMMAYFKSRQKEFIQDHGDDLDKKYRLPVVMHTHTGFPGGYCMHARQLIQSLLKKKIQVHYKFIGGCNDDEPDSEIFPVDDLRNNMGNMSMAQVTLSTGLNCMSNSGKYKIGFTTTEVDGIPKEWVEVLNDMDEVWTTSEFSKKGFIKSGVTKPIYNMREGVDPNYFHPGIKPFENNTKKKFLFISNFAWGRRKGVDFLFEAFTKEFSDKEDVALVLKVLPAYWGADIKKDMAQMYYEPNRAPIHVWDAVFPFYLLGKFYNVGHCFVFPTRGEGFGIPPAEALACGLPIITTDYSAQTEYLKKNGKPLPGVEFIGGHISKFDGSDSIYYKGFNWFTPSVPQLRKAMRKVYNNYKKYKDGAMESSKYIRTEWTWDKSADRVIDRLEKINQKLTKKKNPCKPPECILSREMVE